MESTTRKYKNKTPVAIASNEARFCKAIKITETMASKTKITMLLTLINLITQLIFN